MSVGRPTLPPADSAPPRPLRTSGPLLSCVPLRTAWAWDPPVFCSWVACLIFLFQERWYLAPPFNPLSFIYSPEGQWSRGCLVAKSCPTLCDPTDCSPPGREGVCVHVCPWREVGGVGAGWVHISASPARSFSSVCAENQAGGN